MSAEAMVLDLDIFNSAKVTLDAATATVYWPWKVTMNFWAKSVSTGVFLVGFFMLRQFPKSSGFFKASIPLLGVIFLGITLLFTVLDLHQPFRAWHMFVYPHFTSMLNIGSWFINIYGLILVLMLWGIYKRNDALFEKMLIPGLVLAFLTQVYTAGLLAQANAREIWQAPTEFAQLLLSAGIAGSSILLIVGHFSLNKEEKKTLGYVLGISAFLSLCIFISEIIFAPQKSEEAAWVVHLLTTGDLASFFYAALILAFIVPIVLIAINRNGEKQSGLLLASVVALIGLWMIKHAWLIAPQMITLS